MYAWNPLKANFIQFSCDARILLEGSLKGWEGNFKLIKCYGPYSQRKRFWEIVGMDDTIKCQIVVLGGDLNFTVSTREVWGENAHLDPSSPFFLDFFRENGLVDIEPVDFNPTGRNGRIGTEGIGKRLDKFLMVETLVSKICKYKT